MEHVTPGQLMTIIALGMIAMLLSIAYQTRATIGAWGRRVLDRYVALGQVVPVSGTYEREQRSDAAERDWEPRGTQSAEPVPDMVPVADLPGVLAALDDTQLVELLALIPGDKDGWRFADSAVAKFIPGRNADWMELITDLRGKPAPAPARPAERPLLVRDIRGEREIAR